MAIIEQEVVHCSSRTFFIFQNIGFFIGERKYDPVIEGKILVFTSEGGIEMVKILVGEILEKFDGPSNAGNRILSLMISYN